MANINLMWFPIAKNLKEFLTTYKKPDGTGIYDDLLALETDIEQVEITVGTMETARTSYPSLEILFDNEELGAIHTNSNKTVVNLWLDCYVQDTNFENNPELIYEKLFMFLNSTINSLEAWRWHLQNTLKIQPRIAINGALSDGDTQRPYANCRILLEILCIK